VLLLLEKAVDAYTVYSVGPGKKVDGGDLRSELLELSSRATAPEASAARTSAFVSPFD
jgi:hypothetical protein